MNISVNKENEYASSSNNEISPAIRQPGIFMKKKLLYSSLTIMYLLVNVFFVFKYGSRIFAHGYLPVLLYLAAVPAIFWLLIKFPARIFTRRTFFVVVVAFSVFAGIVFAVIPQETLRVDRYDMIKLFWDNAFSGMNPYTPRLNSNIPGPFPCYFILGLPLYFLKEMGFFSLAGFWLFSYLLYRSDANMKAKVIALLLLSGSPAFVWEIICRSTIFVNMTLVLGLVCLMEKKSIDGFSPAASAGYGLLTGVVACTRSVAILVIVPYLIYLWRNNRAPKPQAYAIAAIGVFIISFLPFLDYASFWGGYNPFAVQAKIMPGHATAVAGLISCMVALRLRNTKDFVFFQSLFLFVVSASYLILRIASHGWHKSIIGNKADISYFILAFPFLVISMASLLSSAEEERQMQNVNQRSVG